MDKPTQDKPELKKPNPIRVWTKEEEERDDEIRRQCKWDEDNCRK